MTKPMLKLVPQEPPPIDILQVPRTTPTRKPNAAYRSREYLTPTEMDAQPHGGGGILGMWHGSGVRDVTVRGSWFAAVWSRACTEGSRLAASSS